MDSFLIFLKLANIPTSICKNLVWIYQHCISQESECKNSCSITNEAKTSLISNLYNKPYETSVIIKKLQDIYKTKHSTSMEDIHLAAIMHYLDLKEYESEFDASKIYSIIPLIEMYEGNSDLLDYIFMKICELIEYDKLNKEMVYLTLLPQRNLDISRHFLSYERMNFNNCDFNNTSLIRYCLYKKRHWLFHLLENNNLKLLDNNIAEKLNLIRILYYTNKTPACVNEIEKAHNISVDVKDKYLYFYIEDVKWNLEIYNYILKANPNQKEQFQFGSIQSCLETLMQYFTLKDYEKYNDLNEILLKYESYRLRMLKVLNSDDCHNSVTEVDLYNSFSLLYLMKTYITRNITNNLILEKMLELLKKMKLQILNSNNIDFIIETFENIFILIFIRNNKATEEICSTGFLCKKDQIYFVANFLKISLKEMKSKFFLQITEALANVYRRFCVLNNYINDTLWRLDLLKSQSIHESEDQDFISIMLSPPETLIFLCLENDNFEMANEVAQVFNLQDNYISQEIEFMEKMYYIKLKKIKSMSEIIKFCNDFKNIEDKKLKNVSHKCHLKDFMDINEYFMNIIDIALTFGNSYDNCKELFDAALRQKDLNQDISCQYLKFCSNFIQVFNNTGLENKISASQILNCIEFPLNMSDFTQQQIFNNDLTGTYNNLMQSLSKRNIDEHSYDHISHKLYLQLKILCEENKSWDTTNNYLGKLYDYLKKFLQILHIRKKKVANDTCLFDILTMNTALIVGQLLSEHNVKPNELEQCFSKLKLDLVYHIAWNVLPIINFNTNDLSLNKLVEFSCDRPFSSILNDLKDIYYKNRNSDVKLITPDIFLLSYIRKRNWLLAYLINKMYIIEEAKPDTNSGRTKYFNNLLKLPSVERLKTIFNNNNITTVLYYNNVDIHKVLLYVEKYVTEIQNLTDEENINLNVKIDWKYIYEIVDSLLQRILKSDENFIRFKEYILYMLVSYNDSYENYKYVEFISENNLRYQCILENLTKWPANFCIKLLNSQITHVQLTTQQKTQLQKWFHQIVLYENMKSTFNCLYWNEVYKKSIKDPAGTFLLILTSKHVDNLLKWIEIHKPTSIDLLYLINVDYFLSIFEEETNLLHVTTLLNLLQFDNRIHICKELLTKVKKIEYLEFILEYLMTLLPELSNEYRNMIISLKMISCFKVSEHDHMFCLLNKPLLIIEQLIMNTRLERLTCVLEKIKQYLQTSENESESDISVEKIDNLLRIYATKLLVFRGIQPAPIFKNLELKLMQSLDTVSDDSDKKPFLMPTKVPSKDDWVLNEQAIECMCCREVIFSMFNRRHHCRRCGRVVCGNCSYKKMQVLGYGNISVRVCNDCHKQSQLEEPNSSLRSEPSSSKSGSVNSWLLTDDDKHNDIVREEFSYEYAPSVSLCLSLLKLHSTSVQYPRFLLLQCKNLLKYLQDAVSEIDYSFVMQMIKSLVTVAKMISLNGSYKIEILQCNDILLHAELLSLLIEKDCVGLLREINKTKSVEYFIDFGKYQIDSGILRRLREKLIEQEQWSLALEVSTKAGLDETAVFAAWGKNCLRTGALQLAREKFQYCLEKTSFFDASLDGAVFCDYTEDFKNKPHPSSVTLSTISENRPSKTPLLVNQILSILQTNDRIVNKSFITTFQTARLTSSTLSLNTYSGSISTDPAICILSKLQNLNNISASIFTNSDQIYTSKISKTSTTNKYRHYIDPCFYNECLYYLMKYASHADILCFYIKFGDIHEVLNYIFYNKIPEDVFIDIYMKCLEDGKIEGFHEHMLKIDSSLYTWEVYLKSLCRFLETKSMYNILYELQIFMCDYVRAAMTCIRFYEENCNSFRELLGREDYLQKAQAHLKQELEQEQWVQVPPVRKASTASSNSSHSRTSTQPSLIMKINPRNIDKYISTIWRQIEVTKFLAECELENRPTTEVLDEIFTYTEDDKTVSSKSRIPTLFNAQQDKIKLAVLAMVCGKNIEEGFGIAFRIIQDHNLKYLNIYCLAAKYLAQILREIAVIELVCCIQSSGLNKKAVSETCDELLILAVRSLIKANGTGLQLDKLIKLISDVGIKVTAYIESKQLKRAYLLAVRHNRNNDIKRIMWEAERQNQLQIKAICLKRLNQTQ